MNGQFVVVTDEESMMIEGGGIMEAVGYGSVASGVGLGLVAVGLAGYAVYSAFN